MIGSVDIPGYVVLGLYGLPILAVLFVAYIMYRSFRRNK